MKQYYYVIDEVQRGPVSFNELKKIKISKQTMVWYEGLSNWAEAGDLEELVDLWVSIPPPLRKEPPVYIPPQNPTRSYALNNLSKVVLGGFLAVIVLVVFFSFSGRETTVLLQETTANSQMLQEQQRLLEEQNQKIAEQERIERERLEQKQREERQKVINELVFNLTNARREKEKSIAHLNDVSAFKLLRSSSERNRQINEANQIVAMWEIKINDIENTLSEMGVAY